MRGKLLFILIIYFAGFFSAIYFLSPGSAGSTASLDNTREFAIDGHEKIVQARDVAIKIGAGMRQFLCVAGEKASRISEIIKAKLDEQNMK